MANKQLKEKRLASRRRKIFFTVVALLTAGAGLYLMLKPVEVTVSKAVRSPVIDAVYATGIVETTMMVQIAPKTIGRIIYYPVEEHMTVKRGDVLLRMESQEAEARIADAKARVELAEREARRAADLLRTGAGTAQNNDRAQAELRSARAALKVAEDQSSNMIIRSPDNCTVIFRDAEVGELITAGQTVLWLDCSGIKRITADVDEEDINKVRPGMEVKIGLSSATGDMYDGVIERITPKGDTANRSYRVRIALPRDTALKIGMTVEANIITGETVEAVIVPARSVRGGELFIVDQNGRLRLMPVKVGRLDSNNAEITEGLEGGEDVVTVFDDSLKDGRRAKTVRDRTRARR